MELDINKHDYSFIVTSLNETFNNAHQKLETKSLGDLERGFIEQTKTKAKELLIKLGE